MISLMFCQNLNNLYFKSLGKLLESWQSTHGSLVFCQNLNNIYFKSLGKLLESWQSTHRIISNFSCNHITGTTHSH